MRKSEIAIPVGMQLKLEGNLSIPENAESLVIFAHGSGSSRFSPRNSYVAELLNRQNIATLLTDLISEDEYKRQDTRFNIELITERLVTVTSFVHGIPELRELPVGYFGASSGIASALKASVRLSNLIKCVVSRGGRPDLAGAALHRVKAPVLFLVGSLDSVVLELNEQAGNKLRSEKSMQVIEGASHLFEEPGKLDEVAEAATNWFKKYLSGTNTQSFFSGQA